MLYFYECLACCTSMHSYICIVASHLGTIDEPYEGRATGAEPEDDVGGHIPKTDGWNPMCMTKGRYSPSEYRLTNTDLVLIPGKPRSITPNLSIQCVFKYLCIYVFRSCMEP